MDDMRRNLRLIPWLYFFSGGSLLTAVIVPFLQGNFLTLREIFLLQGIFAAALLVGEIPTGYLSDRWGRRRTLILASVLRFLGMLVYLLGHSFWIFAVGEIFLALGNNCYSGTLDAVTYDALATVKKTDQFRKINGHCRSLYFGAEALTNVFGGFLAAINLRAPVAATLVMYGIAILLPLMLTEPPRHVMHTEQSFKDLWRICSDTLFKSSTLRGIVALFGVLSTMGLIHFWFTQPYQGLIELPIAFFGITHAVIVGCGAIAARYAYLAERWIGDNVLLLGIAVCMIGGFVALGFVSSFYGLLFFVIVRVGWTMLATVTNDLCSRLSPANDRSTVLSVKAFAHRFLFTLLAPILGYMTDVFTINEALLLCGVLGGVAAAVILFLMRGIWHRIPSA